MASAYQAYQQALKEGQQAVARRLEFHQDPYLSSLDTFLEFCTVLKETPAQTKEIFTDLITGTKTESRSSSFSYNFMPLLGADSEFAAKWISLYAAQSEQGISDPILVYEVFGRYFVQEGNKRVSVAKFLKAPSILAEVRRIEIEAPDTFQGRLYREYLAFQQKTGLDSILMSQPENYARLLSLLKEKGELSPEKIEQAASLFKTFRSVYPTLEIERGLPLADAFLLYLETFGLPSRAKSTSQMTSELNSILSRLEASETTEAIRTDTSTSSRNTLFSLFGAPLRIAFINAGDENGPAWSREHLEAIEKIREQFGSMIDISIYDHADSLPELEKALDKAVHDRNYLVFTTHPFMLQGTNRFAALYPQIKFLNSSINPGSSAIRTYYVRSYEALFLMGLLAGILTRTGCIGYIADYPIYGEAARINAFAIGVMMSCPQATVYLDWSTTKKATLENYPGKADMVYIAGQEFDLDLINSNTAGLYDISPDQYRKIAWQHNHWEIFYSQIIQSVLNHSYKSDSAGKEPVSYWWGLSNDLLKVHFSQSLNEQSLRLVRQIAHDLREGRFHIFTSQIPQLAGMPMEDGHLPVSKIVQMDWLFENIVGTLPSLEDFEQNARELVARHGLRKVRDL